MKKYKTIKELYEAVKTGEIDELKLEIIMDNDSTHFYEGRDNKIEVLEANGYYDIEKLYPLLFPKAMVMWC